MSADYSRWPVRRRDYTAVRLQQGRVLTDADWNEQALMPERRERLETIDSFGRAVIPMATNDAFKIEAVAGPDLTIGVGRAYVDGLLVENAGTRGSFDPVTAETDGIGPVLYSTQPWLPNPPGLPAPPYAAYLKVWQRERSAVEDPSLIEPALGVDTSTRQQTVWQVKAVATPPGTTCAGVDGLIAAAEAAAAGRLTTGTAVVPGQPDPCRVVPGGGYTGLENQLYRVEVHRGGVVGGAAGATFKWSRDGGAVASRVLSINAARDRIVVDSLGRDSVLGIRDGDWIEVTDEEHDLLGVPGELRRVAIGGGVDAATRTVLLSDALPAAGVAFPVDAQGRTLPERGTRVRRWDQAHQVLSATGAALTNLDAAGASGAITIPGANTGVLLEHGIVVRFSMAAGGKFRTGDFWLFAARTADASIEPLEESPPLGLHAHYAALALVDAQVEDCRTVVPPLGAMESLHYVSGDGQEATPSYLNPAPVLLAVRATVGVERGSLPIAGRMVRFSLLDGPDAGTIDGAVGPADVMTGGDGQASVAWALGWALRDSQKIQRLSATLLDSGTTPVGLPVVFSARLRTADEVAYDPSKCGGGAENVQDALDQLCSRSDDGGCCTTVHPGDRLAEAIRQSGESRKGHVCLCLNPGAYDLREQDVADVMAALKGMLSLTMSGRGARLTLETTLSVSDLSAVSIADLELANATERIDALLEVVACAGVTLDGLSARLASGTMGRTVFRFGSGEARKIRPAIRVRNCTIANGQGTDERRRLMSVENLPDIAAGVVELSARDIPAKDAALELRTLLNVPEDARTSAAEETAALVAANSDLLDPRARRTLKRVAEVIKVGEPLSPSVLGPLLERVRGLADFGSVDDDAPAAIELLDGRGDIWIEDNDITGKVVLYGSLSRIGAEQELRELLQGIDWAGEEALKAPALPDAGGNLRIGRNTLDRIAIAADASKRLREFQDSRELEGVEPFAFASIEGNALRQPFQAIVAESVAISGNVISGQFQPDFGFVYGNAGTVTGNIGRDFGRLLLAAPQGAELGNRRIMVDPSGIHP
jgi:hypothetical protein